MESKIAFGQGRVVEAGKERTSSKRFSYFGISGSYDGAGRAKLNADWPTFWSAGLADLFAVDNVSCRVFSALDERILQKIVVGFS